MAANNDGVWNAAGASFALRLLPHFYQTWWFYSALALAGLLLGYLVYRWRVLAGGGAVGCGAGGAGTAGARNS